MSFNKSKIDSFIKTITEDQNLIATMSNITADIESDIEFESDDPDFKIEPEFETILNESVDFFLKASNIIMDLYICDGAPFYTPEERRENFMFFYKEIYFNIILKNFFIDNKVINEYVNSLSTKEHNKIYLSCENVFFTYLASNYFSKEITKDQVENIEDLIKTILIHDPNKKDDYLKIMESLYQKSINDKAEK